MIHINFVIESSSDEENSDVICKYTEWEYYYYIIAFITL